MILLDTHVLVWATREQSRLSRRALAAIMDPESALLVSAVTAFEFVDLNQRGRLRANLSFGTIIAELGATVLDLPASVWMLAARLPDYHRDPADRMLIAHAIHADLTLLTADETIRRYPVRTLW